MREPIHFTTAAAAKATLQPTLSPAEVWRQIIERNISITAALEGHVWLASIERVKIKKRFTIADMEIVSAVSDSPLGAVADLISKLDGAPQDRALFQEADAPW